MRRECTLTTLVLLVLAIPARGAENTPPMSAEEKALMEAYIKAGTPGPPHAALAGPPAPTPCRSAAGASPMRRRPNPPAPRCGG
ncbi:hypothetical protein H1235_08555 [Pseudoxanthomonas sp. NC8]|nr:hypothetical protein H1235_08555 [Pseudoxanthomonas sp. NC8]